MSTPGQRTGGYERVSWFLVLFYKIELMIHLRNNKLARLQEESLNLETDTAGRELFSGL
jgi:hypothetical protein